MSTFPPENSSDSQQPHAPQAEPAGDPQPQAPPQWQQPESAGQPQWQQPAPNLPPGGPGTPYAGGYYGQPGMPGPGGYGPAPSNGMGTAALVLGIVGLIFSFIPIIGIIAWPMVILAIVFGVLGMKKANRGAATNKGAAVAGLVTGIIGLVICILWVALWGGVSHEVSKAVDKNSITSSDPSKARGVGEEVTYKNGLKVRLDKVEKFTPSQFAAGLPAGGEAVEVTVTITNSGSSSQDLIFADVTASSDTGASATDVADSGHAYNHFSGSVQPGNYATAVYDFGLPAGSTGINVNVRPLILADTAHFTAKL